MIIHRSQRAETLVGALADIVRTPVDPDPVRAETVVVQSLGMERWLAQRLSRRLGIWANPAFPFPRKTVLQALQAVRGPLTHRDVFAFDARQLVWPVATELDEHLARPAFAPLARYVSDDPRGSKHMQLAQRIAQAFDDYVVYRPDLVRAWDAGDDAASAAGLPPAEAWQPVLWRAVARRVAGGDGAAGGGMHMAACVDAFVAHVDRAALARDGFPARLSLFGIATLPPLYLEVFAALGRLIDVHVFALTPSPAVSAALAARAPAVRDAVRRGDGPAALDAIVDPDTGHPLVAGCGRVAREFDALLLALDGAREVDLDAGAPSSAGAAPRPTLLAAVQAGIAANRAPAGDPGSAAAIDPDDRSIAVHACHGPLREVEVLRDLLLERFERQPDLQPHDVVVMTPDIERYAPLVEAVFGAAGDADFLPYHIADRGPARAFEVVGAMGAAVAAVQGRLTASALLDLLAVDDVRLRFGIAADQLDDVRRWVDRAGIRWAVDADDRAAAGQPALAENTWRFGLDRLFLGYAMPGDDRALYAGVLPYDDVEGAGADLLGRLADACAAVFDLRAQAGQARTLEGWRQVLGAGLDRLVRRTPRNAWQHQMVRDALDRLATQAAANGFTGAVDMAVAWDLALAHLGADAPPHGFLGGGVTFCALLPMRSIPFRVVALLGMDDGAFPRLARRPAFDLLAAQPRIGDRSTRDDDRHMFLEAVVAARDALLVTHTGQDIRDGRPLAPSVAVAELLDCLDALPTAGAAAARARVVVRHRAQPFSPAYFAPDPAGRLFSYNRRFAAGARAMTGPRRPPPPFVPGPLPPAEEEGGGVDLDALARFARNPARTFVQRRLGVRLGRDAAPLDDRERLAMDDEARRAIAERWLPAVLAGAAPDAIARAVRAAGLLAPGTPGDCAFADFAGTLDEMARATAAWRVGAARGPLDVDLVAGPAGRISGTLRDVWPGALVWVRFSRIGRGVELDLWVRHLALCALAQPGAGSPTGDTAGAPPLPTTSVLIGRGPKGDGVGVVRFGTVPDAAARLAALLELYRVGQRVPVPLFERASRTYAEALARGKDAADAFRRARGAFRGGQQRDWGDRGDASVAQVYGDADLAAVDALAVAWGDGSVPPFAALASTVYGPLVAHRTVLAGGPEDGGDA